MMRSKVVETTGLFLLAFLPPGPPLLLQPGVLANLDSGGNKIPRITVIFKETSPLKWRDPWVNSQGELDIRDFIKHHIKRNSKGSLKLKTNGVNGSLVLEQTEECEGDVIKKIKSTAKKGEEKPYRGSDDAGSLKEFRRLRRLRKKDRKRKAMIDITMGKMDDCCFVNRKTNLPVDGGDTTTRKRKRKAKKRYGCHGMN
eukprot:jgi/Bigna1/143455/aug1.78_g18163